jgi:hypothetical protein
MIDKETKEVLLYLHILELEDYYRETQPKYSDQELLDIFPEAKKIIPSKIREWESRKKKLERIIKSRLREINNVPDELDRWLKREGVKCGLVSDLVEANRNLYRLESQMYLIDGRHKNNYTSGKDTLARAKEVGLVPIVERDIQLKKTGKIFTGQCPFHEDRHPSFVIYPDSNRWMCYGCGKQGDVIDYVMLKHGLNFHQAIDYLIRGNI